MHIPYKDIENLNRTLVNLSETSDFTEGYNQLDYQECKNIYHGLTPKSICDVLNKLFKYIGKSFLPYSINDIQESLMKYMEQITDFTEEHFINFNINSENDIEVRFKYQPSVISAIQKIPRSGRQFSNTDTTDIHWVIKQDYLQELLKNLDDIDIDTSPAREYLSNIKEQPLTIEADISDNRVRFITNKPKKLNTIFIDQRAIYKTSDNVFVVALDSAREVLQVLKDAEVDTSEFEQDLIMAADAYVEKKEREKLDRYINMYKEDILADKLDISTVNTKVEQDALKLAMAEIEEERKYNKADIEIKFNSVTDISVRTSDNAIERMLWGITDKGTSRGWSKLTKPQLVQFYNRLWSRGYSVDNSLFERIIPESIINHNDSEKSQVVVLANEREVFFKFKPNIMFSNILMTCKSYEENIEINSPSINILELESVCEQLNSLSNELTELKYLDFSNVFTTLNKYREKDRVLRAIPPCDTSDLKKKPFKHQEEAVRFLLSEKTAILGDEMGLGKTKSSLLAVKSVFEKINGICIIVCPSIVKLNWAKEIREIDTQRSVSVVMAGCKMIPTNYIIINYDILSRYMADIIKLKPIAMVIDEAHYCTAITNTGKPNSLRAKCCVTISAFVPFVWEVTGTPFRNKAIELYNILKIVNHPLALSFKEFGMTFGGGKRTRKGMSFSGFTNRDELNQELNKKMLRRRKKDHLDLPEKMRTFMPVEIDLKAYNDNVQNFMAEHDIEGPAAMLVLIGALKKYLAYEKIPFTYEISTAMLNEHREEGEDLPSVVIFTDYTRVIDELYEMFTEDGISTCKITGKQSQFEKQASTEAFQRGEYRVALCNRKAAGVGINLFRAKKLVFNDLTWVPFDHFQAEDRIHRIGQDEPVDIYYLYCEKAEIDEKLANTMESKAALFDSIVDGGMGEEFTVSMMKDVMSDFAARYGLNLHSSSKSVNFKASDFDFDDDDDFKSTAITQEDVQKFSLNTGDGEADNAFAALMLSDDDTLPTGSSANRGPTVKGYTIPELGRLTTDRLYTLLMDINPSDVVTNIVKIRQVDGSVMVDYYMVNATKKCYILNTATLISKPQTRVEFTVSYMDNTGTSTIIPISNIAEYSTLFTDKIARDKSFKNLIRISTYDISTQPQYVNDIVSSLKTIIAEIK